MYATPRRLVGVRAHRYLDAEYRICDVPSARRTIACGPLQAYESCTSPHQKIAGGFTAPLSTRKSRAARFGIDGALIDFGKGQEVPFEKLLDELLEFVDDVVDELGSRKEVYYAREIIKHKPGADRQLAAYETRHDMRDVVDYIIRETEYGV